MEETTHAEVKVIRGEYEMHPEGLCFVGALLNYIDQLELKLKEYGLEHL